MSDGPTYPATNGAGTMSVRDRVAAELRAAIDELTAQEDVLAEQLAALKAEKHDLERSLRPLTGEPAPGPKRRAAKGEKPARATGTRVGPEKMARFEAAAREMGAGDAEFRQIDVLRHMGIGANSGMATYAFEQLREAGVIRLARQQRGPGGGKFFRLTRPALREAPAGKAPVAPIRPPKDRTRQLILDAVREHGRPATYAVISERTGVGDVALRNAVHTLQAEGALQDAGPAAARADGATHGKMPRTFVLGDEAAG
jgi:hypothetical protein